MRPISSASCKAAGVTTPNPSKRRRSQGCAPPPATPCPSQTSRLATQGSRWRVRRRCPGELVLEFPHRLGREFLSEAQFLASLDEVPGSGVHLGCAASVGPAYAAASRRIRCNRKLTRMAPQDKRARRHGAAARGFPQGAREGGRSNAGATDRRDHSRYRRDQFHGEEYKSRDDDPREYRP
jgi:hypothetical protein